MLVQDYLPVRKSRKYIVCAMIVDDIEPNHKHTTSFSWCSGFIIMSLCLAKHYT